MSLEFNKGYAGVLIVVLSIMASVGVGYVMNINEVTYTKEIHEQVADITGLFDRGTAPEYIEYNPSENITGYHTDSNRDNIYFGGVEYSPSQDSKGNPVVNNYPLRFQPIESAETTYTLSDGLPQMNPPVNRDPGLLTNVIWGLAPDKGQIQYIQSGMLITPSYPDGSVAKPSIIKLETLITALNVGDVSAVVINIPDANNSPIVGNLRESGGIRQSTFTDVFQTYIAYTINFDPSKHVGQIYVDLITDTCTFKYTDGSIPSTSALSVSDTFIAYHGESNPNTFTLADEITYYSVIIPPTEYLDITQGVVPIGSGGSTDRYTVSFTANNGGSVYPANIYNVPNGSHVVVNGNKVTINGTTVTATPNEGYVFSSWSNTSGNITSDRTIVANFTRGYTYTLIYNDNTGTGGPGTDTAFDTSTQHQFTISNIEPTKTDYIFLGWSLTQYTPGTGTAQYGADGELTHTIRNSSSNPTRTLYAVWKSDSGSGTQADPYTAIDTKSVDTATIFNQYGSGTNYILVGSQVRITNGEYGDFSYVVDSVDPGHGLSVSGIGLTGNITGQNNDVVRIIVKEYIIESGEDAPYADFTFTIVDAPGE